MAARKGRQWIYWLMVGLILVGFGGWFTGGAGGRVTSIGSVGGLEIPAQTYANAVRNQIGFFAEQTGQDLTFAEAQAIGLDRAVLGQLVDERALDAEAQRLGLSVGNGVVDRTITRTPTFQGLDGTFDQAVFDEWLARNGLRGTEFKQLLREQIVRNEVFRPALLRGVPAPQAYGEVLSAFGNERRAVTWATIGPDAITAQPEPTEEELAAFYEAQPDLFTSPETRQVSYAWITPEMIQAEMQVSDEEARALYDERIDQFVQAERRLVERLPFDSEEAAQDAMGRLDAGEATFEALVEERGIRLSDIDLGDVSREELEEAGETVFAAATGEVVGPLPSPFGPALFRVNAVLAPDETPFEEVAPDLRAEIADERARDAIAEMVPQVEDLIAGGAGIEDLAEQTDLEAGEIAWSEGVTEGPAAYQEFREAAAAAQEGDFPQLVEMSDGGVFVLRLDGVSPPELRSYEEVAAEVEKAWEAQALREAVAERAEAAATAIAEGATFEEQGLEPSTEPSLTRRSAVEGTAPGFIEAAFALEPGGARALPTEEGALVLRLDSVEPASADDPAVLEERAAYSAQAAEGIAQDLYDAFTRQLRMGTEVQLNDQAIAAVNAQMN